MWHRTAVRILIGIFLLFSGACGGDPAGQPPGNGGGKVHPPEKTDIFVGGLGGYHTYRIPALAVAGDGTLLAFCEGRKNNAQDHGDIDLVLRRSFDRGRTWDPMQLVWEDGDHTIGNPSPVLDRETGTIWLGFCRDNDRVYITRSEDDGATWAVPLEITGEVKLPGWTWYATGPGHGIQLSGGRLLIPCDHHFGLSTHSHVIYSDDHGLTWQLGGTTDRGMNECMAVERADGSVYLSMRNLRYRNNRAFSVSTDRGDSWPSVEPAEGLTDPVCQASILRGTRAGTRDRNRILFLNPASTLRENLTLKVSYDEAVSWPVEKLIQEGAAAYSDMAMLPDGEIAALYENGTARLYEKITFASISLGWVEE